MRVRAELGPITLESQEDAQALLLALYGVNLHWLRSRPGMFPPLLQSGIRYRPEKTKGKPERWKYINELYADGFGDCEDLACALAAELTVAGRLAAPIIYQVRDGLWHIIVVTEDGEELDPSRSLGMGSTDPSAAVQPADIVKRVARSAARATTDIVPAASIAKRLFRGLT